MDRDLYREILHLVRPIHRKIQLVATKLLVHMVDDDKLKQELQVELLAGEVSDEVEHMQPGGLSHNPPPKSTGVYLTIGGVRDDGVAICVSRRGRRPTGLKEGETVLYSDVEEQCTIILKEDGTMEFTAPTKVVVNAPAVELGGPDGLPPAIAERVEAELNAVATTFNSYAGQGSFAKPYTPGGGLGAAKTTVE